MACTVAFCQSRHIGGANLEATIMKVLGSKWFSTLTTTIGGNQTGGDYRERVRVEGAIVEDPPY